MSKEKSNNIIIIGGGYAGLRALKLLAKNKDNNITLFDKNSYHFMQTEVYDLIANETDFAQVSVDFFTYCMGFDENVTFQKQEITNIDFDNKKIITQRQRYNYDYLIIAVGARTKFHDSVKGLREYAYGVKALHRAMYFKQKFEMSLFKKVDESGSYCDPINIIIAGAGLSGVEIAAQMSSFAKEFYKKNNFLCRKLNIVIVNSSKNILKNMDQFLVKKSLKRLTTLGVVIKNERKVIEVGKDSVRLSSGELLPMDFIIYSGGIEANGLVYNLNIKKNESGFISTNNYLQCDEYKEVFAIGDCTSIYQKGELVSPTADIAEQMADLCAENVDNIINGRDLVAHTIKSRGILIALGRRYATAKIAGINMDGYIAYIVKKAIERFYAKSLNYWSWKGCKKIFRD